VSERVWLLSGSRVARPAIGAWRPFVNLKEDLSHGETIRTCANGALDAPGRLR
jgi:hypothetical protein